MKLLAEFIFTNTDNGDTGEANLYANGFDNIVMGNNRIPVDVAEAIRFMYKCSINTLLMDEKWNVQRVYVRK